jgi:glutamate N-acetyltransferase / amino-acid N-acetyltransferase
MAVNLHIPKDDAVYPVPGVEIGVTEAGIRKANRRDLTVFKLSPGSTVAGVFTRNRFCAAPVLVCQEHLSQAQPDSSLGHQHGQRQRRHGRAWSASRQ